MDGVGERQSDGDPLGLVLAPRRLTIPGGGTRTGVEPTSHITTSFTERTESAMNSPVSINSSAVGDGNDVTPEAVPRRDNEQDVNAASGTSRAHQTSDLCALTMTRRAIGTLKEMSRDEKELKLSLYFHISNPFTRLAKFHRFPLKFAVHLIKLFCIVTQAILFINSPSGAQSMFKSETQKVFSTLLIQPDVIAAEKGARLAPSTEYTAYSIQDVKTALDFAGFRFGNLSSIAVGNQFAKYSNGTPLPIDVAITEYVGDKLDVATRTYMFNAARNISYFSLDPMSRVGIVEQLDRLCVDNCIERFLTLTVTFHANDIRVRQPTQLQCYNITSTLQFVAADSRILHTYSVAVDLKCMSCQNYTTSINSSGNFHTVLRLRIALGIIVFAVCIASFYLTIRALMTTYRLAKAMGIFYHDQLHIELSWKDQVILFEYWHVVNILSDLCTILGTILVIYFDQNFNCTENIKYDADEVRIFLGIGIILQASVILRYISYFPQFNVLSRALEIAFPRLLKYIIFVTILFTAFMICGWLVLSPFHSKFSTINVSFYTLFTMLNGDDLYNTFTGFSIARNMLVYIFGQAFFTIFMTLFIYAILNLFVSIIVEAREESQDINPLLKNEVRRFVFSGPLTDGGVALRDLKVVQPHMYVEPDVILQR